VFKARLVDVGYLDLAGCMALGATGPILRSTGLPHDLRKSQPYCGYEQYEFDVPTADTCDSYGRFLIRLAEMEQSLRIVEQCLDQLRGGATGRVRTYPRVAVRAMSDPAATTVQPRHARRPRVSRSASAVPGGVANVPDRPDSVSRLNRFKSARNSAAVW